MGLRSFSSPISSSKSSKSSLAQYAITENGFLPADLPLQYLPDSYYEPWERIVSQLPALRQQDVLRHEIQTLKVLSTDKLRTEEEWRRAYNILGFMAHAYIWGGKEPQEILPPSISVPFLTISKHLELPPVATYAGLNLWNFACAHSIEDGGDFGNLDSLSILNSFTGTIDEAWFYLVSVAVEAQGAPAIPLLLKAMELAKKQDYTGVSSQLQDLIALIGRLGVLLVRMYEKCQPKVFYHDVRPCLAGSKNMAAAGLPNGVFYDQGDGKGEWMQLRGGSNAQSSLIQFFDVALGVRHTSTGENKPGSGAPSVAFHEEMREYMPGPHRRFLEHVIKTSTIQEFALATNDTPEQSRLREAYQAALKALSDFRSLHLQMVTKYIIIPARQSVAGEKKNLASASSKQTDKTGQSKTSLTGTGGTDLIPFLKQTRTETTDAGVQH